MCIVYHYWEPCFCHSFRVQDNEFILLSLLVNCSIRTSKGLIRWLYLHSPFDGWQPAHDLEGRSSVLGQYVREFDALTS